MSGLIDSHAHLNFFQNPVTMAVNNTWDYMGAMMGKEAERYLLRGFTFTKT